MSDKDQQAANCGCAETGNGQTCPCKKRICLPILGLAGLAIVAFVAARRRNRK